MSMWLSITITYADKNQKTFDEPASAYLDGTRCLPSELPASFAEYELSLRMRRAPVDTDPAPTSLALTLNWVEAGEKDLVRTYEDMTWEYFCQQYHIIRHGIAVASRACDVIALRDYTGHIALIVARREARGLNLFPEVAGYTPKEASQNLELLGIKCQASDSQNPILVAQEATHYPGYPKRGVIPTSTNYLWRANSEVIGLARTLGSLNASERALAWQAYYAMAKEAQNNF